VEKIMNLNSPVLSLQSARLLGFVQVRVGTQVFALPVQSVHFERDQLSAAPAGGFFTEDGADQYGIIVDGDATESEVQAQIKKGSEEAFRHISRRFLN
jgi:hypothetical protein